MRVAADAVQFRILGPLHVSRGDISLDVGPPQRRAVLAVLLSNVGDVITPSRLVECVWGETAGNSAQSSLHAHMSRLRKALGPRLIDRRPHGYTISIHPSRFDAESFRHLALAGRSLFAEGDLHRGRDQLRDALALWRGRAYEQFEDAFWARREIVRLDAERLAALTARIDADLAIADIDVIGELEALMIDEPQHDGVCARLMLALYRSGRHADALSAYHRHVRRLGERSGLAPSPTLRHLERQILQHDAALTNERDRIRR